MGIHAVSRLTRVVVAAVAAALLVSIVAVVPISAIGFDHGSIVAEHPRTDTPRFLDGKVNAVRQVGDRIIVGGSFSQIEDTDGTIVAQRFLAAYNVYTGALDRSFAPDLDNQVRSIHLSEDGSALFIGGKFNHANGYVRNKLAKLDLTGATITAFRANATANVLGITVGNGKVYVTGQFVKINGVDAGYLAAVDATTGDVDPGFDLPLTGGLGVSGTLAGKEVDITPDDSTLVVFSTAAYIDGLPRYGVALVDVSGATAVVSPWRTTLYQNDWDRCAGGLQIRDGELSPDGSYFVAVGKGHDRPPACDTAVAFPTAADPDGDTEPVWVTRLFDSGYSVSITDVAVYVGGHFRYVPSATSPDPWPGNTYTTYGNPAVLGSDVVPRDQIAALDPSTGKALDWDTSTNSFEGVLAMQASAAGLLIGHDRQLIGSYDRGRHGVFPLLQQDTSLPTITIDTPLAGSVTPASVPVAGSATDDIGVSAVWIAVYDRDAKLWLRSDGSWGGWQKHATTLSNPGATSTTYSYALTLHDARFLVRAWAEDPSGQISDPRGDVRFEVSTMIDFDPPEVTITAPTLGSTVASPATVTGVAYDDGEVAKVWMAMYDRDAKLWLRTDGSWGAWQKHQATIDDPGAGTTGYSHDFDVPDGSYLVSVWAEDGTGKITPQPRPNTKFLVVG